jgi:hypothetical protein
MRCATISSVSSFDIAFDLLYVPRDGGMGDQVPDHLASCDRRDGLSLLGGRHGDIGAIRVDMERVRGRYRDIGGAPCDLLCFRRREHDGLWQGLREAIAVGC